MTGSHPEVKGNSTETEMEMEWNWKLEMVVKHGTDRQFAHWSVLDVAVDLESYMYSYMYYYDTLVSVRAYSAALGLFSPGTLITYKTYTLYYYVVIVTKYNGSHSKPNLSLQTESDPDDLTDITTLSYIPLVCICKVCPCALSQIVSLICMSVFWAYLYPVPLLVLTLLLF